MKTVAFDLETVANPRMIEFLPPIEPNARLKDPEKIKADIEEKKLKQIEDMGVDKWFNMICAASFKDMDTGKTVSFALDPEAADEKGMLKEVWDYLHRFQKFITFNGTEFDVPVLIAHSAIHRVQPTVDINAKRYGGGNHLDLRMILNGWDKYAKGNFDFFCKLFLKVGKPLDIDGAMVQHYWDCGMIAEIVAYCEDDVERLSKLYARLEGYYV